MSNRVSLDLALQGGGAHGAFTWGVLDRLLDEKRLTCGAISGASAGALNAVVMADGLLDDGPAGAQKALWTFWKRVSRAAHLYTPGANPFHALFFSDRLAKPNMLGPWWPSPAPWLAMTDAFTRMFSPYQFNPLNLNPLVDVLEDLVDFDRLKQPGTVRLFVSATNVRTGGLKIFHNADLSARAVMASACLPHLFQAVEIDGEPYWDGGYVGNPALLPLIAESAPDDLMIIQLNPQVRNKPPRTASTILDRLNEITFNASLMKELRSVALLKLALEEEAAENRRFKHPLFNQICNLRLHRITADEDSFDLGASSKLDPEWGALIRLHDFGARAADQWLTRHGTDLGKRSTLDLEHV